VNNREDPSALQKFAPAALLNYLCTTTQKSDMAVQCL